MKCSSSLSKFSLVTPIGEMIVLHCQDGLHSISQIKEINDSNFKPHPKCKVALKEGALDKEHAFLCFEWLAKYFNNSKELDNAKLPNICVMKDDGNFSEKVCLTLAKRVKFGEIVTYKQLAQMAGSPEAARAVGSAMSNNPLQLLVPCHRVLPTPNKSGCTRSGNYAFGHKNSVKQWLLSYEGHELEGDIVKVKHFKE